MLATCWYVDGSILCVCPAFSFPHLSFDNWAIASVVLPSSFHLKIALGLALGKCLAAACATGENTDVHKGLSEPCNKIPGKPLVHQLRDVNSSIKFRPSYDNSFAPALGGALCHGNEHQWHWSKHFKFRPSWIMTVPQRLSFSAQLSNCNLAPCCHIELSILRLLHLSISIHLSNKL